MPYESQSGSSASSGRGRGNSGYSDVNSRDKDHSFSDSKWGGSREKDKNWGGGGRTSYDSHSRNSIGLTGAQMDAIHDHLSNSNTSTLGFTRRGISNAMGDAGSREQRQSAVDSALKSIMNAKNLPSMQKMQLQDAVYQGKLDTLRDAGFMQEADNIARAHGLEGLTGGDITTDTEQFISAMDNGYLTPDVEEDDFDLTAKGYGKIAYDAVMPVAKGILSSALGPIGFIGGEMADAGLGLALPNVKSSQVGSGLVSAMGNPVSQAFSPAASAMSGPVGRMNSLASLNSAYGYANPNKQSSFSAMGNVNGGEGSNPYSEQYISQYWDQYLKG